VCDIDEMVDIKDRKIWKEDISAILEPYDFYKLQISNEKSSSKLALPFHKNTMANGGSPGGLCNSEGDA